MEETSKKKDKGHSSSKKSENSLNQNSDEEEGTSESELWKGPVPETDEKSQEEEFDEYFQDLFLWDGREKPAFLNVKVHFKTLHKSFISKFQFEWFVFGNKNLATLGMSDALEVF